MRALNSSLNRFCPSIGTSSLLLAGIVFALHAPAAAAQDEPAAEAEPPPATAAPASETAPSEAKAGEPTKTTEPAPTDDASKPVAPKESPAVEFGALPALPDAPKDEPKPAVETPAPTEGTPETPAETKPSANTPPPAVKANKPRMLVMDLVDNGAGPEVAKALTAAVNQQAIRSYNGIVTTAEEIRLTLTVSAQQQLTGCMEPRCMADVGKTIEADIVLGGNVTKVGDDIVITVLSTNARTGERMGSEQRKVPLHQDLYFYAAQQLTSLVITGKVVMSRVPVRINSSESAAEVLVDGRALGYAPLTVDLDPGVHSMRITQSGFVPWQANITVVDGTPLEVNATLSSETIALWPVATGALVVGVVFVAMAGSSLLLAYENYNGGLGLGDVAHDANVPVLVDLIPRRADSYREIKAFNAADLATLESRTNTQTAIAGIFGGVGLVFGLSAAALFTADLILE